VARVAADVGAINVDAHRDDFGGVGDFVDVAQFRADPFDHAGLERMGITDGARWGGAVGGVGGAVPRDSGGEDAVEHIDAP
jgi:hypothetical protein